MEHIHYQLKTEIKDKQKKIDDTFRELTKKGQVEFITFHPSYSYEEFIEGVTIKDEIEQNSSPYYRKDGFFKVFCARALQKALNSQETQWKKLFEEYSSKSDEEQKDIWKDAISNPDKKFVLIIDEINRGDISKIFGELITLLEADKRLGAKNELIVKLPCSNDNFSIPPNLFIVGTMNTADRSIALIDIALRRRFGFVEMPPNLAQLKNDFDNLTNESLLYKSINKLIEINNFIRNDETLGKEKEVGHSFFYAVEGKNDESVATVWINEIFPLLEEYFFGESTKLTEIFDKNGVYNEEKNQFTREKEKVIGWLNGN